MCTSRWLLSVIWLCVLSHSLIYYLSLSGSNKVFPVATTQPRHEPHHETNEINTLSYRDARKWSNQVIILIWLLSVIIFSLFVQRALNRRWRRRWGEAEGEDRKEKDERKRSEVRNKTREREACEGMICLKVITASSESVKITERVTAQEETWALCFELKKNWELKWQELTVSAFHWINTFLF